MIERRIHMTADFAGMGKRLREAREKELMSQNDLALESGCLLYTSWSGTAVVTGFAGRATALGEQCLAVAWGEDSLARGTVGNWIVVSERDDDGNIIDVKIAKVDGDTVKADTWYKLVNGEIMEA